MEKRNRHTLTEFREDPETYAHQVQSTGCPIVLTVDGKDALVVQDAEDYRRAQAHLEQIEYDAIMDGLDDVKHGRVRPAREALEELFAKYGYNLVITAKALLDVNHALLGMVEHSPSPSLDWVARWRTDLFRAIDSLEVVPARCPYAPERCRSGLELRQYLVGRHGNRDRIVFIIEESAVRVLRILPASQPPLDPNQIVGN